MNLDISPLDNNLEKESLRFKIDFHFVKKISNYDQIYGLKLCYIQSWLSLLESYGIERVL